MGKISVSYRTAVHQVLPVPTGMTAKFRGRLPRDEGVKTSFKHDYEYTVPVVGYVVLDRITIREAGEKIVSETKERCVEPLVVFDNEMLNASFVHGMDSPPDGRGGIMSLSDWDWDWNSAESPSLVWFVGLEMNGLPYGPAYKPISEYAKIEEWAETADENAPDYEAQCAIYQKYHPIFDKPPVEIDLDAR